MTIATDYTTDTLTSSGGTLNIANNASVTGNLNSTANVTANNIVVSGSVNSASIRTSIIAANTDYILSSSDSGKTIFFNNSLPTFVNVGTNLFVGFRTILTSVNTGLVTIRVSSPTVTLHPRIGTQNQITGTYASASIVCYSSNTFILDGSIQ
jgi:hypothetical protein